MAAEATNDEKSAWNCHRYSRFTIFFNGIEHRAFTLFAGDTEDPYGPSFVGLIHWVMIYEAT